MKVPAVAKRASWNLIEQMISSLTNAVLTFMVAKAVTPVTFGGFAVAFTVFTLVIGAARAVCTSPLNIRFSDAEPAEQQRAASAALGLSVTIALVVALGTVVAGWLVGGSTGEALRVMGLVLPAVILLDSYRYVFFSRGTPHKAAINGIVFAVLQLSAVGVLLLLGVTSVGPFIALWGLAGAAAVGMALYQSRSLPRPRLALGWLKEQNDLTRYTFASWATQQGTMQGALLVIAVIGTVVANGSLRGAQTLLGPAAIISSSALTFAIPEFSRRRRTLTDRQWMLAACGVSGVVALLALCWGAIFLLMPDAIGAALLEETWTGTREVLLPAVVAQVLGSLTVGPVVMIYAIDRAKATFRIHLVLGTMVFLGGVIGVVVGGGPGAQWGFAIANGTVLPFWFVRLWRELQARAAAGDEPDHSDADLHLGDAEATAVLAPYRRRPAVHYFEDLESAQMATMVLPRITGASGSRPGAGTRRPPTPRPSPVPRTPTGPGPGLPPGARPGPVPPLRPGPPAPVARPDVAPHQPTADHVLPSPPPPPAPRPSPRPRPAPDATTVVPVVAPGERTTGVRREPGPGRAGPAGPRPAGRWFDGAPAARPGVAGPGPAAPPPRPTPRPRPSAAPPTAIPPDAIPPTAIPPTAIPPDAIPPVSVAPDAVAPDVGVRVNGGTRSEPDDPAPDQHDTATTGHGAAAGFGPPRAGATPADDNGRRDPDRPDTRPDGSAIEATARVTPADRD